MHQAPAFGQEDYDAAVAAGFISPERLPPCPVDDKGQFTSEVPEYAGNTSRPQTRPFCETSARLDVFWSSL